MHHKLYSIQQFNSFLISFVVNVNCQCGVMCLHLFWIFNVEIQIQQWLLIFCFHFVVGIIIFYININFHRFFYFSFCFVSMIRIFIFSFYVCNFCEMCFINNKSCHLLFGYVSNIFLFPINPIFFFYIFVSFIHSYNPSLYGLQNIHFSYKDAISTYIDIPKWIVLLRSLLLNNDNHSKRTYVPTWCHSTFGLWLYY